MFLWALQKTKIQTEKIKCEYILFRIDVNFIEYFLAVEIDEKGHTDREILFLIKKTRNSRKKSPL